MSKILPRLMVLLALALWLAWPHSTPALAGPLSTSPTATLLAQFELGLRDLGRSQYAARQAGSAALRQALARLMARMIRVSGPERQARIAHLLRYQEELTRWARAVLHLPLKERLKMLQWGIRPKILPLVAGAYSYHQQCRASVAHALAKIPGRNADWLLSRLVNDPHRLVYLTTMDALWNRQPTPAMIKSVWHRAVILGTPSSFQQAVQHMAVFRGRKIPLIQSNNTYWTQVQGGVYATDLLEHWKPKNLSHLVVHLLAQMCRQPPVQNIFNTPYTVMAKDLTKLLLLAKPAQVEPYLLFLIHQPMSQNLMFIFNNRPGRFSNRTLPLYLLIKLAGKDPVAYHLYRTPVYGGVWAIGTLQQENAAIKKITAWYAKHKITAYSQAHLHAPAKPPTKK